MRSSYKELVAEARALAALLLERRGDLASCVASRLASGAAFHNRRVSSVGLQASAVRLVEALASAVAEEPASFARYVATRSRLAAQSGGDQERLLLLLVALQEEAWLLASAHLGARDTGATLSLLSACIGDARDMLAHTIAEQACTEDGICAPEERDPAAERPDSPQPRPAGAPAGER